MISYSNSFLSRSGASDLERTRCAVGPHPVLSPIQIFFHLLVFVLGFGLAVLVACRGKIVVLLNDLSLFTGETSASASIENTQNELPRYSSDLASVLRAVESGERAQLQLIRPEFYSGTTNYRAVILPALKKRSLAKMISLFSDSDWQDWPLATQSDGAPTGARCYVDDVRAVNPSVGRFLETSALLLHGMYLSIMSGSRYQPADDLYYALRNADRIFSERNVAAIPARSLLDSGVLEEPDFVSEMERLRGLITVKYVDKNQDKLSSNLALLLDLRPASCDSTVFETFRTLVYRITVLASPRYREESLQVLLKSKALPEYIKFDSKLSQRLAGLYVVSALDAIERGDFDRGRGLLALSVSTKSGLRAQSRVAKYLNIVQKQTSSKVEKATEEEDLGDWFLSSVENNKSTGNAIFQNIAVLIIVGLAVLVVGGRMLLAYLSQRSVNKTANKPTPALQRESNQPQTQVTSPSELSFDDELLAVNR